MPDLVALSQEELWRWGSDPASRIAITVAKAMAERGDDVGPNVTLVLLATIEARDQQLAERRREIDHIETERERQRVEIAKELERTRAQLKSSDQRIKDAAREHRWEENETPGGSGGWCSCKNGLSTSWAGFVAHLLESSR